MLLIGAQLALTFQLLLAAFTHTPTPSRYTVVEVGGLTAEEALHSPCEMHPLVCRRMRAGCAV